ncbi:dihydropteroate synthase [Chloroflexota bacterium]
MPHHPAPIRCRNTEFRWGERTYIMGILNLSPDSFSGDGIGYNLGKTVAIARQMVADGADILDIGGESTKPGTEPVPNSEIDKELALVVPAIERLAREMEVPLSIDTYKANVAREAIKAGANIINDIWGLKWDADIAKVAAEYQTPIILMDNQRDEPTRVGIMAKIIAGLNKSIGIATAAGVERRNIIVDPGIGFGKTLEQNMEIVHRLGEMKELGLSILLGTSRKSMIGLVLDLPPEDRLEGTAATCAIGIAKGADIIRVHDVKEMARVAKMSDAIIRRGRVEDASG